MTVPASDPGLSGPYAQASERYATDLGWAGVIPVRGKWPPPTGWTGEEGGWPSYADREAWREERGADNIALRLPAGVIGIDVDNYGDKRGALTLAEHEARLGPLPETYVSTSRLDGISGIRLLRVPEGLAWPGQLPGGGVELIRTEHRYCMAPPSIHPETGEPYRWRLGGSWTDEWPRPDALPLLPVAWLLELSRGQREATVRADLDGPWTDWVTGHGGWEQPMCRSIQGQAQAVIWAMTEGSRHEALLEPLALLLRLAERGHRGIGQALRRIQADFTTRVVADGSRTAQAAGAEFGRAVTGGLERIEATPTNLLGSGDPCEAAQMLQGPRTRVLPDDPAPAGPEVPGEAPEILAEAARTTWSALNTRKVLSGEMTGEPPAELVRADGARLLYAGRINGLVGPSESGKSWLAQVAVMQAAQEGRTCWYIDFEDTASGIADRLRALGMSEELIDERVLFTEPAEPMSDRGKADIRYELATHRPGLVILDGVNAAMTLCGLDLQSNRDATVFFQEVLSLLTSAGATLLYVDHTPKNDHERLSAGGIGAQAKRAMTTGAAFRVEAVVPFGRNQNGVIKLWMDKDKNGFVRELARNGLISTVEISGGSPLSIVMGLPGSAVDDSGVFRPTILMARVLEYLDLSEGPRSINQIRADVQGKASGITAAVKALVLDGEIASEMIGRAVYYSRVLSLRVPDEAPRKSGPGEDGESPGGPLRGKGTPDAPIGPGDPFAGLWSGDDDPDEIGD